MHRNILTHVPEGWEVQDGGATSDNSLFIASSQGKKTKKREDTRKKMHSYKNSINSFMGMSVAGLIPS